MAIFTKEFEDKIYKIVRNIRNDLSNSLNYFWLHLIVFISLIIAYYMINEYGVVGLNAWWEQFSVSNPNIVIEYTIQYCAFMIGLSVIKFAACLQGIYLIGLAFVGLITDTRSTAIQKKDVIPQKVELPVICPDCHTTMDITKNGTRNGNQRYYCKSCKKYFTKTEQLKND